MIITSNLYARGLVSHSLAHTPAMGETRNLIAKYIVTEGEKVGAFINPRSVHFDEKHLPGTDQIEVSGEWCPDPTGGCLFIGGPYDGYERAMPAGADGRPPEEWRMTVTQERQMVASEPARTPVVSPTFIYARAGKDSAEDKWVYQISS